MTEVEKYFLDKCEKKVTNRMRTTDEPWRYRHPDHYNMATKAYDEGRKYYYFEPVDPNNPYGKLRECEPKYVYECSVRLTEDEYEELKSMCE